jgi:hypothetical protein
MTSVPHPFRDLSEKDGKPHTPTGLGYQETNTWRPRDFIAAAILFLGSAGFVLWQNLRVAVLWDLGYLLDTSYRITLGQMPYRDFPLAHPPLTFFVQAALIRLAGRHYLAPVLYAAAAGGLGTVLAWRILLRTVRATAVFNANAWLIALLLSLPLMVLGIYSVYPHPIYDCDCALAILFALLLLARVAAPGKASGWFQPLAAGAATVVPLFFKQNIGLPFLAVVVAGFLVLLVIEFSRTCSIRAIVRSQPALALAGMAVALFTTLTAIASTAGLGNYFHWTVQFAAQRRLPGLASMIAVYREPSLLWTLPTVGIGVGLCHTRFIARSWARIVAFCLIAAPFAGSLIFLFIQDDADERADNLLALWPLLLLVALLMALLELRRGLTLNRLMPFFVLAAIHGAFLSQQLWGSTYALWPLLMILVAQTFARLPAQARPVAVASVVAISITFLVCGGLYAISLERLSYVQIPDALIERSTTPALGGMADRGPYLHNLEELVAFAAREIPPRDGVLPLPGEDPFFYATGRVPQFPVTLFDPATDPYSATELMAETRRRNIRWVIVKRVLQINANPQPEGAETLQLIPQEFALYKRLDGYDIYRLR